MNGSDGGRRLRLCGVLLAMGVVTLVSASVHRDAQPVETTTWAAISLAATSDGVAVLHAAPETSCQADWPQRKFDWLADYFRTSGRTSCPRVVARFQQDHPVKLYRLNDALQQTALRQVPLKVWIFVLGDEPQQAERRYNARKAVAGQEVQIANRLYNETRSGIGFMPTFMPIGHDAATEMERPVTCKDAPRLLEIKSDPKSVNVYYLPTRQISGPPCPERESHSAPQHERSIKCGKWWEPYEGLYCPERRIVLMASSAPHDTLTHELGHLFGLPHIVEELLDNNIMYGGSKDRNMFTPGQSFLMNFSQKSTLKRFSPDAFPPDNWWQCGRSPNPCPPELLNVGGQE